jgi:hypothetical protein
MADSPHISLPQGCLAMPFNLLSPPCLAGVDIRTGSWDVIIADLPTGAGKNRVLRPVFIGKLRDEHEVLWLCRQYRVRCGVADCRPEGTLALRMQEDARKYGIEFWRAEYNTNFGTEEMTPNREKNLVKLDRTLSLDVVHHNFRMGVGVVLPQNYREANHGKFAAELCASQRIPTRWQGKDTYQWEKTGDDHGLHALNYLWVAYKLSGMAGWANSETMAPMAGLVESTLSANLEGGDEPLEGGEVQEAMLERWGMLPEPSADADLRAAGEAIIGYIDENGYLHTPLSRIAAEKNVAVEHLRRALPIIQRLVAPFRMPRSLKRFGVDFSGAGERSFMA